MADNSAVIEAANIFSVALVKSARLLAFGMVLAAKANHMLQLPTSDQIIELLDKVEGKGT